MGSSPSKQSTPSKKSNSKHCQQKDCPITSILGAWLHQDSAHSQWEKKIQLEQLIRITATFLDLLRQIQQMQRLLNATAEVDAVADLDDEDYMRHLYAGFTPIPSDVCLSDCKPSFNRTPSYKSSVCLCSCAGCLNHPSASDDYLSGDSYSDSYTMGSIPADSEDCTPRLPHHQDRHESKEDEDHSATVYSRSSTEQEDDWSYYTYSSSKSEPKEANDLSASVYSKSSTEQEDSGSYYTYSSSKSEPKEVDTLSAFATTKSLPELRETRFVLLDAPTKSLPELMETRIDLLDAPTKPMPELKEVDDLSASVSTKSLPEPNEVDDLSADDSSSATSSDDQFKL